MDCRNVRVRSVSNSVVLIVVCNCTCTYTGLWYCRLQKIFDQNWYWCRQDLMQLWDTHSLSVDTVSALSVGFALYCL